MAANSAVRRLLKRVLYPVINNHSYRYFQGLAKAWDIRRGSWSEPELELLPLAVRPGETAFDIGANFGVYAYHLARAVGTQGRVYSFEPVPFTFQTLTLVAKLLRFRNVELISKGCSDKSGRIKFTVPVQASGALSAGQAYIGGRNDDHAGKEEQVRWNKVTDVTCDVIALDEFLPQVTELSLIKCDIEGAELWAFRGAEQLINRYLPTVICEINPWFLDGFGIPLADLIGFFTAKDFRLYHYGNEQGRRRLRAIELAEIVEDNYVFIHPTRLARFASLLEPAG